jgi:osmotically-inducible protein OsmY
MQTRTDAEIQSDVVSELEWDARLDAGEIGVAVRHGVVTLIGNVASNARRSVAAKAAHRVAGVRDVANDLEVVTNGARYADSDLAEAVRHALEGDALVPHEQINSTVSHGMVQLSGEVEAAAQRDDAARAVRNLIGVRGVVNEIELHQAAIPRPAVLAEIEQALERHVAHVAGR